MAFPPISSVENNGSLSSDLKLKPSQLSYTLSHRGIQVNLNKHLVPKSSLKKPWPVKNKGRIPAVFQLESGGNRHSSTSGQTSEKDVLPKAYIPPNSANDIKSAKFVSSKLRNVAIPPANINESIKFTIKSKVMLKNSRGNNLWQKSMYFTRNKMASSRNVTSTERIEDKKRAQDTRFKPLLRMATLEKQFSIRNTINKFKKWHFEQNTEQTNTPIKTQNSQTEGGKNILFKESLPDDDFVRMFETKIAQGKYAELDSFGKDNNYINNNYVINANGDHNRDNKLTYQRTSETRQIHPALSTMWSSNKTGSEMVNKMKEFQEENNTVNFDKEQWIQVWVAEAQTTMEQTGRELCQTFD